MNTLFPSFGDGFEIYDTAVDNNTEPKPTLEAAMARVDRLKQENADLRESLRLIIAKLEAVTGRRTLPELDGTRSVGFAPPGQPQPREDVILGRRTERKAATAR